MNLFKNTTSQKLSLFVFDYSTGAPKTGDAGNLTAYVNLDWAGVNALTDSSASEIDSTTAKGWYLWDLTQGETNATQCAFTGKSTTANVVVVGEVVTTIPPNFPLLSVDSNGRVDVIKIAGTTQTARDLGASVLLSSGTGTGQIKIASGYVAPDWGDVGNKTTSNALTGTTIATTQKVDIETIKTNPVVNGGTITFPTTATLASTTNITAGTITTVSGNVTGSVGSVVGAVGSVTGAVGSVTGNVGGNVTGSVGSVVGNVGGSVASVVGAVGSVTGNVGGNVVGTVASVVGNVGGDVLGDVAGDVVGSVGSVATGGIVAGSFAAGAIDNAAIASNAIGAAEIATGAITAAKFAASAIDAAALATDAVQEIRDAIFARAFSAAYGSLTFDQVMSVILATQAAKTSGGATTTFTIRNLADGADVIVATVDASGNRTAVTVTP